MAEGRRRVVIGIGNPDRGDDAAGRALARALRAELPADVAIAECDGEATALLSLLEDARTAVLVDAALSGAPPGSVRRFEVERAPLPAEDFALSSHGIGLSQALELARALGRLPARCTVYAIEGERFEAGAPLSPAVAAAVGEVAGMVRADLEAREAET